MIINSSDETIYKKQKKGTDSFVVIAPGENKVPRYVTLFCILLLHYISAHVTKYHIFPKNWKIKHYYYYSDWLRERDFDITAFYYKHPRGEYGLNAERKIPLTPQKYFSARVMNKDSSFAKDADYVLVAQQYLEKTTIENQIDVAMSKGKKIGSGNEITFVPESDLFHIFAGMYTINKLIL